MLSYLDLLEQPGAFYASTDDNVKRKLLAAYFSHIWIDDDGHRFRPAAGHGGADSACRTPRFPNAKGTESISVPVILSPWLFSGRMFE